MSKVTIDFSDPVAFKKAMTDHKVTVENRLADIAVIEREAADLRVQLGNINLALGEGAPKQKRTRKPKATPEA